MLEPGLRRQTCVYPGSATAGRAAWSLARASGGHGEVARVQTYGAARCTEQQLSHHTFPEETYKCQRPSHTSGSRVVGPSPRVRPRSRGRAPRSPAPSVPSPPPTTAIRVTVTSHRRPVISPSGWASRY